MPNLKGLADHGIAMAHRMPRVGAGELRRLFDRSSLRLRLVGLVVVVELIVIAVSGYQMLLNAREAVRDEVEASTTSGCSAAMASMCASSSPPRRGSAAICAGQLE